MESKLITKQEIKLLGFEDKQVTKIWRDVKRNLIDDGFKIYGQRTKQIPRIYVMRYFGVTDEVGVSGEGRSHPPDQAYNGGLCSPFVPACQVTHKKEDKNKVKKVQISIPYERYFEIEKLWLELGFSSVAEAGKFLIMNNVDEFFREIRKAQRAISKLNDLKKSANNVKSKVARVQPKVQQIVQVKSNKVQTSGYILKDSLEYNRIVANWQEKNPNFKEHTQAKGLH